MTKGDLDRAIRRAHNNFDEWVDVTGALAPGTSYYYEMQKCIEDAVHFGAQAATGDYLRLQDETTICADVREAIAARKLSRNGKRKRGPGVWKVSATEHSADSRAQR